MLAASIMTIDSPAAFHGAEPDNTLLLTPLQPENLGNPALVIVELAIAFAPRVELANGGYRSRSLLKKPLGTLEDRRGRLSHI